MSDSQASSRYAHGGLFCVLCFMSGMIVMLLFAIVHNQLVPTAQASTGGKGDTPFIVGSGIANRTGEGCLWIVDPENKVLCSYIHDNLRGIKFVGARKIEFDLKVVELNDMTDKKYQYDSLKKEFKAQGGDKDK